MTIQTYKVKYVHGHFIETESNQRIIPIQGAEYVITGTSQDFSVEDEKFKTSKALNSDAKKNWANRKFGKDHFHLFLKAEDQLMFRVGNSKRIYGDESREYIFLCTLKEDLYLFLTNGGDSKDPQNWRLGDCFCQMEKCLVGGLTINEKFTSESLNKLFTQTVMFYFNLQRSGSTNVFSTFCIYKADEKISFSGFLNNRYTNLASLRAQKVKSINEKVTSNK